MGIEIYNPGQADILFDIWPEGAEWFVIGGPADGNEAQTVKAKFPNLKCVGFEPARNMLSIQEKLDFPGDLYPYALWKRDEPIQFRVDLKNGPNTGRLNRTGGPTVDEYMVDGRMLDTLNTWLGPWKNMVLWLDIERSETEALAGAVDMLSRGDILMINVELMERDRMLTPMKGFLGAYGFELVKIWNRADKMCDAVFRLKDS